MRPRKWKKGSREGYAKHFLLLSVLLVPLVEPSVIGSANANAKETGNVSVNESEEEDMIIIIHPW